MNDEANISPKEAGAFLRGIKAARRAAQRIMSEPSALIAIDQLIISLAPGRTKLR